MDFIPENNTDYRNVEYWQERFAKEQNYEWCKGYESFKELQNKYVKKEDNILIVGNGNSKLPIDLHEDGYTSITSLDYAQNSIDNLKLISPPCINYICSDMRTMTFERRFDTVIEKGVIDVLFTAEKSPWTISEKTSADLDATLSSIKNSLNDNGQFISVTFGEPFFRKKHYSKYWNNIHVETYGELFHYYFIICKNSSFQSS